MLLSNILSFVVFPVILLFNVKIEKRYDVISIEDSDFIRGVAAIFIFFAHFYTQLYEITNIAIGKLWLYMGGVGVCVFFFLSGYGLNKSDSIEKPGFIIKRLKNVVFPFVFVRSICFFFNYSLSTKGILFFLEYILGIVDPLWFVSMILIIYFGYYICYKMFGKKNLNAALLIYNIVIGILFAIHGAEPRWYNSHLLFSFGMIIADNNKKVIDGLQRINWWLQNLILGILFLSSSILFSVNKNHYCSVLFKVCSGIFLSLLIMNLLLQIRFQSVLIRWIGKNSLLFYIIHLQVLNVYNLTEMNKGYYILTGMFITIISILAYNTVKKRLFIIPEKG